MLVLNTAFQKNYCHEKFVGMMTPKKMVFWNNSISFLMRLQEQVAPLVYK